ncbi:MAG TPA: hypothetical protein VFY23_02900 [Candidatus Limnocylindrales bacterium]|nr:hypothetical protein [Candidatus Limnocylindrales bacterium]
MRRIALGPIALALVLAAAWLAPAAGIGGVSSALAAATDLTLVADTTYTVRPEDGRVRVVLDLTARNNTRETTARRFYFDHAFLAVQPGARSFRVSGWRGGNVRVRDRSSQATLLRINFGSRLYSGQRKSFRVAFDLVDPGKPANRSLRVGPSLVTLPVWAHATNGAKGGTVTVRLPAGYEHAVEAGRFDAVETTSGGGTELRTKELARPLDFFAYVSAQRPPTYVETPLDVAVAEGETVPLVLRAWTEDEAWAARVGSLFGESLPVLREQIGLPWPHAEPMTIQEAVSRSASGYAGLFDPAENLVEVAYWADHGIVIHEAAHGWFNGALLADRWANEGFASLYAARVADAIDEPTDAPELTDELREARIPLNAWAVQEVPAAGAAGAGTEPTADADAQAAERATEAYGYAASLALARAIAERAGEPALRQTWADASAGIAAYQPFDSSLSGAPVAVTSGDLVPEVADGAPDWRALLDILERRTGEDFDDLWREWVVRPDEVALLEARTAARASYERTLALAGDWALPRDIRDAMRSWQFEAAEQRMADARTVLAQRGANEQLAADLGIPLPAGMRTMFETGALAEASSQAEAERNAMLMIAGAADADRSETDPLTTIGMLGEDPEAELAAARAAVAAGDLDGARAAADDAFRAWNGAWQEGRRRALLAVAVLATLLVLGSAVVGRLGRASAGDAALAAASAGVASPGPRVAGGLRTAPGLATSGDHGFGPMPAEPTVEELLAASAPVIPDLPGPTGAPALHPDARPTSEERG